METGFKVYSAINAVQEELSRIGIAKTRTNAQQNFKFRGIDDVYSALAPLLSKYKLCIVPEVLKREQTERVAKSGGVIFCAVVEVKYHIVSAEDGSKIEARTFGEAMDNADKATNKAMSAAYKYLCLQTFCIPTDGDNDADATAHDIINALTHEQKCWIAGATDKSELEQICGQIKKQNPSLVKQILEAYNIRLKELNGGKQ